MRGANDGERLADLIVLGSDEFCGGHVDEFDVPFGVDHEILWFDVTADDLVVVEVLQNEDDARAVELAVLSGEQTDRAHDLVKVLPAHVLLQVKETVLRLERFAQLKHEWKRNRRQDLLLLTYELLHLKLLQHQLVERFYCVKILVQVPDQVN